MRFRGAVVCAAVCVLASTALPAQERQYRTLLSSGEIRAVISEASGERAMHRVLELLLIARPAPLPVGGKR